MPRESPLTQRQLEVVRLVTRGLPNKAIAAELGVSERAVEATLTRLYEKLDLPNRSALIAAALSETGFGLAIGRRVAPASPISSTAMPASLEEELRAYEQAPFMVAVTQGPEHRYTFINRVAAEVAGRVPERMVGRTVRELYPDLDQSFAAALDGVWHTGIAWSTTAARVTWTHEDGSVSDGVVNLIFQPLRDGTGAVVGLLHIGAQAAVSPAPV